MTSKLPFGSSSKSSACSMGRELDKHKDSNGRRCTNKSHWCIKAMLSQLVEIGSLLCESYNVGEQTEILVLYKQLELVQIDDALLTLKAPNPTPLNTLYFFNVNFRHEPKFLSSNTKLSIVYSDSSSSASWQLGIRFTWAYWQSNEYEAKVPPSSLSSALSIINTFEEWYQCWCPKYERQHPINLLICL